MDKYVLRYEGELPRPPADIERIQTCPELKILDDSSPRMLLVEATGKLLEALIDSLPNWVMAQERSFPLPDTRRRVRKKRLEE
jgi:hypothetical protein